MARISLGLATSHGPMLSIGWEHWADRVPFDRKNTAMPYRGKTYTFPELAELRRSQHLERKLTPFECAARHARCQSAIAQLADGFAKARIDAAVIVGNDQMEVFSAAHVPASRSFGVGTWKVIHAPKSSWRSSTPPLRAPNWIARPHSTRSIHACPRSANI